MTSPPCQAFSLAGRRKGEDDRRGLLFYNSHEFIQKNRPRFFQFENVKGLLSDDKGKTFQRWIDLLAGKSVNGNPVIFPHDEAVPYHVYYQVMNAKEHGIPQNRERIFIIGIRDDQDNDFSFAKPEHLQKRLKDILENEVDEKYFLSDKIIAGFLNKRPEFAKQFKPHDTSEYFSDCLTSRYAKMAISDAYIKVIGNTHPSGNGMNGNVFDPGGIAPTLSTNKGEGIKIGDYRKDEGFRWRDDGNAPTLCARAREDGAGQAILKNKEKIRRLTPTECLRLMDFNPDVIEKTIASGMISDSQLYKQAGNSICVGVLAKNIKSMKHLTRQPCL